MISTKGIKADIKVKTIGAGGLSSSRWAENTSWQTRIQQTTSTKPISSRFKVEGETIPQNASASVVTHSRSDTPISSESPGDVQLPKLDDDHETTAHQLQKTEVMDSMSVRMKPQDTQDTGLATPLAPIAMDNPIPDQAAQSTARQKTSLINSSDEYFKLIGLRMCDGRIVSSLEENSKSSPLLERYTRTLKDQTDSDVWEADRARSPPDNEFIARKIVDSRLDLANDAVGQQERSASILAVREEKCLIDLKVRGINPRLIHHC